MSTDSVVFDAERPRLLGLAYRMLGTVDDAEDVVQEAWLRYQRTEAIERPEAWLTTVTARLAVDRLRANRRRREDYIGPWLPEPIVIDHGPEDAAELSDTLTLGFLAVLDTLGPVERVVFLLRDVFDVPFSEIAPVVERSEAACRQIASRSRRRVASAVGAGGLARRPRAGERRVVADLLAAVTSGDVELVMRHLASDAVLISDGGAQRRAARRPVVGAERVARLMINLARRSVGFDIRSVVVNDDPGVLFSIDGHAEMVVAFAVEGGLVTRAWAVRNPDKLDHLDGSLALR